MARPQKIGISYFPLDVDIFDDEKVEAISGEFGLKGELVVIKLLCAIYRNGYFIVWDDLAKMKLTKRMPGVNPELLEQIVLRLVKWNFFDKGLFESARVLSSRGIQKRWKEATRKRVVTTEGLDYWILEVSGGSYYQSGGRNGVTVGFPAEETPQSKVKESKEKESKGESIASDSVGSAEREARTQGEEKDECPDQTPGSKKRKNSPPSSGRPPSLIEDKDGILICTELRAQLVEYRKQHPGKYEDTMYVKFLRYWSEPNKRGKPRWMTEKIFQVPNRLATWKQNDDSKIFSNRAANPPLRPTSRGSVNYAGEGNVREVEI